MLNTKVAIPFGCILNQIKIIINRWPLTLQNRNNRLKDNHIYNCTVEPRYYGHQRAEIIWPY